MTCLSRKDSVHHKPVKLQPICAVPGLSCTVSRVLCSLTAGWLLTSLIRDSSACGAECWPACPTSVSAFRLRGHAKGPHPPASRNAEHLDLDPSLGAPPACPGSVSETRHTKRGMLAVYATASADTLLSMQYMPAGLSLQPMQFMALQRADCS